MAPRRRNEPTLPQRQTYREKSHKCTDLYSRTFSSTPHKELSTSSTKGDLRERPDLLLSGNIFIPYNFVFLFLSSVFFYLLSFRAGCRRPGWRRKCGVCCPPRAQLARWKGAGNRGLLLSVENLFLLHLQTNFVGRPFPLDDRTTSQKNGRLCVTCCVAQIPSRCGSSLPAGVRRCSSTAASTLQHPTYSKSIVRSFF